MSVRNKTRILVGVLAVLVVLPTLFSGVGLAQTERNIEIAITDSQNGYDNETVSIEIEQDTGDSPSDSSVPADFPGGDEQYNVIIDEYDKIGPISLAQLVTDNADQGDVGGVEFSPIELAQVIDWNANR